MASTAIITPVTLDDLPTIATLAGVIWRQHYPGIITHAQIDYMLARFYAIDVMTREMTDEDISYDLLAVDETPIGFVSYGPGPHLGETKIHKLYLSREYHGRGLGSKLLDHAIDRAKAAGSELVLLNVNKHNDKAIATYKRNGFVIRESVVVDIGEGYVMDDYVMVKAIS